MGIDLDSTQFEENGSIKRSPPPFFSLSDANNFHSQLYPKLPLLKNYNKISCNKIKEAAFFRQPLVPFAGLSSNEIASDISNIFKWHLSNF
jgi:hypothetical protein